MNESLIVWKNGELIPADEVTVSPFDLGLSVGLGVFETMVAYDGEVFAYGYHHDRMKNSAKVVGVRLPERRVVEKAMREVIEANGLGSGRARVRVSVSGGENPLHGGTQGGGRDGNVIVLAMPQPEPLEVARVAFVPFALNEKDALVGVKSASYGGHVLAYRHALNLGADEALMCNTKGALCEGAMSNVFLVKDGVVRTPELSSGCLPGVTRALVIELCKEEGLPVEESTLWEDDVLSADELFLTSSAREVQSASLLEKEWGGVGPVTERLARAYRQLVQREIGL